MKRKCIAVITARADAGEQRLTLDGILWRAYGLDVDVCVFSNLINDSLLTFENIIYDYFDPSMFDGVILAAEPIYDNELLASIVDKIRRSGVPAVMIGSDAKGFASVKPDYDRDFDEIVRHLVLDHGFTDIDILGGPETHPVAEMRLSACRKAFEKYGVPFDEKKVHSGYFWFDFGQTSAQKYISGEYPMPQAIICTNDYIAFGLCDEFSDAGIAIPDTVSVVGYDCIGNRIFHTPALTTFNLDRGGMGSNAVDIVLGNTPGIGHYGKIIPGNTCSCGVNVKEFKDETKFERILQFQCEPVAMVQFNSQLMLCRTMEDYITVIRNYFDLLIGVQTLYLYTKRQDNYLCCKITGHESREPVIMSRKELLSRPFERNENWGVYYFSPLTFQTEDFGYTVIYYDHPEKYNFTFKEWNKSAANALKFLRMKNDIHYLEQCRRGSDLYDSLTGFYKPEKFRQIIDEVISQRPITDGMLLGVRLSFVSDEEFSYGENYQSDIVTQIASAIKHSCFKHEIYTRSEDNFFVVMSADKKPLLADRLISMVEYAFMTKYGENHAALTFTEYTGNINTDAFEEFCALNAAKTLKAADELKARRELHHFSELCAIRRSIYLSPECTTDVSVLCRKLCISEGHFRAIYKDSFGVSFLQDCINAKILLSKYLLCTTSMSIFAIAQKCGYADEKYFSRQFRKSADCTPMQYRADTFGEVFKETV